VLLLGNAPHLSLELLGGRRLALLVDSGPQLPVELLKLLRACPAIVSGIREGEEGNKCDARDNRCRSAASTKLTPAHATLPRRRTHGLRAGHRAWKLKAGRIISQPPEKVEEGLHPAIDVSYRRRLPVAGAAPLWRCDARTASSPYCFAAPPCAPIRHRALAQISGGSSLFSNGARKRRTSALGVSAGEDGRQHQSVFNNPIVVANSAARGAVRLSDGLKILS
jgi:hypothetical protein